MSGIVVIGGGQAGASLAAKLRSEGFEGDIILVCAEPVPPYQRPPLSKAYLLGEMERERLYLRPAEFYADQNIRLLTDSPASAIDPSAKTVTVGDETLFYDHLALTTGSIPRNLPDAIGGALKGVHTVRALADIDTLAPEVQEGKNALIVGGGYIGLEAAAVARKRGMNVTLVEMAPRILARVACPETSDYFRALHEAHGVTILENTGLDTLLGEGRVSGARLSDGTEFPVDLAIVGIGIAPDTALAEAAGLTIDNGIATDPHGQTSDPNIWAAGDCASFPYRGSRLRLESVQNAIDQAECAALNMLGKETPYDPKPWFWSDQYDCKLQIAGLGTGHDRIVTRKSDAAQSHWHYKGDTLLSVDAMNDPRAYMVGKRLIEMGKSPDPAAIEDPETDLKALLRA